MRLAHLVLGNQNKRNDEDVALVTIPTTKLQEDDCESHNLAATFQKNNYRTGMIGK